MAARKAKAYRVVGAAAVVRKDKRERYLYRGATFSAGAIDEANAKHLLSLKLIEAFEPADADSGDGGDDSGSGSGSGDDSGSGSGSGS